jgi:hypothetical protein
MFPSADTMKKYTLSATLIKDEAQNLRVLNWLSTDVSEVRAASIIRAMMDAARTCET